MKRVSLLVFLLIISSLLCSSCQIVGLTSGYNDLTERYREQVLNFTTDRTIERNKELNPVILIDHKELLTLLKNSKSKYQLVYFYNPQCRGALCIPMTKIEGDAKRYGVEAFIISRFFDPSIFKQKTDTPVYVINGLRYKSKYVFRYAGRFQEGLSGGMVLGDNGSNAYLFKEGKYLRDIYIDHLDREFSEERIDLEQKQVYSNKKPWPYPPKWL